MALRWLFDRLRPHQNEAGGEPPAKRQKVVATTDRVKLNVGGAEFETTVMTLTSNSAYFASLFSDNWSQSKDCDGGALFLDQDPAAFATLLAYMRCGMIKTDEIDVNVTALAEFLGIEQLLRAIKIRWYINIGKGPVVAEEDDIAAAFDREHGGILNALSSGLFHYFRNGNTVDAEWDYFAILTVTFSNPEQPDFSNCTVAVNELRGGEAGQVTPCGGAVGALNGLSAKGYNLLVSDDTEFGWYGKFSFAFARKSHSVLHSRAMSDVLIPADECALAQVTLSKQYAIHVKDTVGGDEWFIAPGEFGDDADPFAEARVSDEAGDETNFWLKRHNFHTRDKALEQHPFIQKYLTFLRAEGGGPRACAIYYRLLPGEHEGK